MADGSQHDRGCVCCWLSQRLASSVSAKCPRILITKFNMKYNLLYRQPRPFAHRSYGYEAWRGGTVRSLCGPGTRYVLRSDSSSVEIILRIGS